MYVDCTRWITASPDSSAPIALRTTERAPSQPIRKRQFTTLVAAAVEIAQSGTRAILFHHDVVDRRAVEDADAWLRGGMLEQDRLEKNLVDAVRRLRRRPVAIGAIGRRETVLPGGNMDSRQFLPGERSAVADVVRIICRQSGVTDFRGHAEPPEDFHGAGGNMVALRLRRCGGAAGLHHSHVDAPPREVDREREPDRSGAHDQNIGVIHAGPRPASQPQFCCSMANHNSVRGDIAKGVCNRSKMLCNGQLDLRQCNSHNGDLIRTQLLLRIVVASLRSSTRRLGPFISFPAQRAPNLPKSDPKYRA